MTFNVPNSYINGVVKRYPVVGPDVSKWQGIINWSRIAEWAKFVYIRVGYGGDNSTSFVDSKFRLNWPAAKAQKIPRGGYWYFKMDSDPIQQATFFCKELMFDKGELDPIIDVEENLGNYNATECRKRVKQFMNVVDSRTGKKCGIYTSYGFVTSHMQFNIGIPMYNRTKWVASWDRITPLLPPGFSDWDIWQFVVAKGLGRQLGVSSHALDLNVFNGTQAEFNRWAGIIGGPTLPTLMPRKVAPISNLYIREKPTTASKKRGMAYPNHTWKVLGMVEETSRRKWVKIAENAYIAYWLCRQVI